MSSKRVRTSSCSGSSSCCASAARELPKPAARVSRCWAESEASGTLSRAKDCSAARSAAPSVLHVRGSVYVADPAASEHATRE
eukprot:1685214-Prymnesium_polylepis.1